ncbi:hypothetical protein C0989_011258 [Termitomyces sp. Mn162]|nr:hypothetical protein C0989_011258 [Termitomyces sp. Mn162]
MAKDDDGGGYGAGSRSEVGQGQGQEKRQEYKRTQGACDNCWADNDPEGCCDQGGVGKECEGLRGEAEGAGEERGADQGQAFELDLADVAGGGLGWR